MRSKLCDDGKRRILAKVEVAIGTDDILTFALVHPSLSGDEAMNDFENLNKRQLFNLAKETIRMHGTTALAEMVDSRWSQKQITRARQHVRLLFPEVD